MFELRFSEKIGVYTDVRSRLMDSYIGIVFCLLVIFSFMSAIKKNYIHEYERAKMADQLKSSFLANMSHEIRTPLNAIVGFSSLISEPDIAEKDKQKFMEQILSNSDYLLSLIEDIIDVSKIESNQLTVKIRDFDVIPHIEQVVQAFQLAMPANKNVVVAANLNMTNVPFKPILFPAYSRQHTPIVRTSLVRTSESMVLLKIQTKEVFRFFHIHAQAGRCRSVHN